MPVFVGLVGILYLLLSLLAFLGATALLATSDWALGILTVVLAIFYLLIAVGSFKGWSWVWLLAIVFGIINILSNIYTLFSNMDDWLTPVLSILIGLLILWYLFTPKVKRWFRV
jgi:hypothetical protein